MGGMKVEEKGFGDWEMCVSKDPHRNGRPSVCQFLELEQEKIKLRSTSTTSVSTNYQVATVVSCCGDNDESKFTALKPKSEFALGGRNLPRCLANRPVQLAAAATVSNTG